MTSPPPGEGEIDAVLQRTSGRPNASRLPHRAGLELRGDAGPPDAVRRAPFAENPRVGARGQRTQQRILDAALEAFGELGYEPCGIEPIASRAGCSRAAFYQYFSDKEDVFRHLTGQVARQLGASTEALEPLTADESGWRALRAWVARHAEIYDRHQPVFRAFQAASESDRAVATGAARWRERTVSRIRAKIVDVALPPRALDPLVAQLLECVVRTHDVARIVGSSAADPHLDGRVGDALADVLHRSLFGFREDVPARRPTTWRASASRWTSDVPDPFGRRGQAPEATADGRAKTREALVEAGRKVFAERGYHRTRVGDVIEAAGVSRGAFYRYFENKDRLARTLATRAMRTVSRVLAEIPAPSAIEGAAGRAALRRWLRRYHRTQAGEAAMLRVWVDASLQDATLRSTSAAALEWGRRAMVAFLEPRGFGDAEVEGLVLVALLSAFGARERTPAEVDAAARVIERGLLGLDRR